MNAVVEAVDKEISRLELAGYEHTMGVAVFPKGYQPLPGAEPCHTEVVVIRCKTRLDKGEKYEGFVSLDTVSLTRANLVDICKLAGVTAADLEG